MSISNNPAFPCEARGDRAVPDEYDYIQTSINTCKFPGLTIRDWFAGQALAGIMANPSCGDDAGPKYAYFLADEMLAERAKAGQP